MRLWLYNALRKVLTQERRADIKRRIAFARRRLAGLYRARHGSFDAQQLTAELAAHVPPDTEIIMVHCSINDLEPMYTGTARDLLEALIELAGPERTLAMPAFFFAGATGDVAGHYRDTPVFDARRQISEMGIVSEAFRRYKGVRRSLHPTHSVCALGPLADDLTSTHHVVTTTFGEGTPFAVMAAHRTVILGVGTTYYRSLTQVHAAEDLLGDRYPVAIRPTTLPVELPGIARQVHRYELPIIDKTHRQQTSLLGRIADQSDIAEWKFHGVPMFATTAS